MTIICGGDINMERLHSKKCCRFSWHSPWKILLPILLGTVYSQNAAYNCPYGEINPEDEIHLLHGKNLIITCQANHSRILQKIRDDKLYQETILNNNISDRIVFYKSDELVPKEYVTIVNATAARLNISNPNASQDFYYCKLNLGDLNLNHSYDNTSDVRLMSNDLSGKLIIICLNYVRIGYAPLEIKNFSCISINWEELKCKWTKPENPINTEYKIYFSVPDSTTSNKIYYKCSTTSDIKESSCVWNLNTNPLYQIVEENYTFTLNGTNIYGNSTNLFYFNNFANVIPNPPDISVLNKTPTVIMLKWSINKLHVWFKFHYKIEYKSQWGVNNTILLFNETKCISTKSNPFDGCDNFVYNLTNLYPFTNYNISVYIRSSQATDEDKWSKPSRIRVKTKPMIPIRPPRTDIGSFQSFSVNTSTRNVLIYWQHIKEHEKLGKSFKYYVNYTSTTVDNKIAKISIYVKQCYAEFEGLNTSIDYTFYVYSANNKGLSTEYSIVYVPRKDDMFGGPTFLTNIIFDKFQTIELSWKDSQELSTDNEPRNYTLFWCDNVKYHLNTHKCNGILNWTQILIAQPFYNITKLINNSKKMYKFAISYNSLSSRTNSPSSSGMVWTSCTVILNKSIVETTRKVRVSGIDSRKIELRWKFDCSDRIRTILGFYGKIFYCPVNSKANNSTCIEPEMNKIVTNIVEHDNNRVDIKDLKPDTTYKIRVDLFQNGQLKETLDEPLFEKTMLDVKVPHDESLGLGYRIGIAITLPAIFGTIGAYWGKKIWRKYKLMKNIQIVLPPTLVVNYKQ